MKKFVLTGAIAAACLGIAACGDADTTADDNTAAAEGSGNEVLAGDETSAAGSFPQGARIVEENGVTYRVDADGTRVALGPNDARIVVEDGVRYRVDPDGTRVRISDDGLAVDLDGPDVDVDLPDVDVGINEKGNPDIDVGDRDPDGGR